MLHSKTGTIVFSLAALFLAGCQSQRIYSAPTPQALPAAPSGTVTGRQLPPPAQTGDLQFPDQGVTDMAALDPNIGAGTAGAPVEKSSVTGSWSVNAGGTSCQMFLTLTKFGNMSRGGTRGCGNELANVRAWDVSGNQVVVYDENGGAIARLHSGGTGSLNGQTSNGTPISLSR